MADPPVDPETDTGGDAKWRTGRGSKPPTPRWVTVFGIIGFILAVLVVLMLTGVLGKGHGPGRHLGGSRGAMPHENPGARGVPADANEAARTVEVITLDTMTFKPSGISVFAEETVTFAVTNSGKTVHEFTIGDAAMQEEHSEMMAHIPAGMVHDTPNSMTLQPGQTKRITWRFGGAGTLEYACHQRGHYRAGMRGQITIT